MTRGKTALTIPLLALLCAGCATIYTKGILPLLCNGCGPLYTARLSDVNASNFYVPVDQFGAGQIPVVVVSGFGGQMVMIRIVDLHAGWVVEEKAEAIPRGRLHSWWSADLPNGAYQAILLVDGSTHGRANFTVSR